ncbi:MAG TPA: hypothetical protein VEJ63_02070, partial [Planctomycetota bacterium]|nr:hypothetical protein [Planctomycetota bacterium]
MSATPTLDSLTHSPLRLSVVAFAGPLFFILLGACFAIGIPLFGNKNPNAPALEVFIAAGTAIAVLGLFFASRVVSRHKRMLRLVQRAFQFEEIYRNRFVTFSLITPLLRVLFWSLCCVLLALVGLAMLMQTTEQSYVTVVGGCVIGIAVLAFLAVWFQFLHLLITRFKVISGGELSSVEGEAQFRIEGVGRSPPRYLDIGGRSFNMSDCSGGGPALPPISGTTRVWFDPGTGVLVRAEWRRFNDQELIARVNTVQQRYMAMAKQA